MKYIRTKDGKIYDTLDERGMAISQIRKQCDFVDFVTFQNRLGDFAIPKTEIVKQADTIEELCDEFVVIDKTFSQRYVCCYIGDEIYYLAIEHDGDSGNFSKKELSKKGRYDVYGAIWTDKGLIYVAKMNDDGELELL